MAALLRFGPDRVWTSRGGLFDWTLEYLIDRLSDQDAAAELQEIVDNNLAVLWVDDLPLETQKEIAAHLRTGLLDAAERELPDSEYKPHALQLVALTEGCSES
jgi:hypothetical protein